MTVKELTRDQLIELKRDYLIKLDNEGTLNEVLYNDSECKDGLSLDEYANADELITDDIILNEYDGYVFSEDDFAHE